MQPYWLVPPTYDDDIFTDDDSRRRLSLFDSTSEDCLYLNVFCPPGIIKATAANTVVAKLPVMVFIHGGSFHDGSARTYNATNLAIREKVIIVVIQYRLGVFGFAGSSTLLKARDSFNSTGNYGLQDQRFALRWVKDNIAKFGGDPTNVVLWGQSTGGYSVGMHMIAQRSAGLFHKAIMESGGIPSWLPYSLRTATITFDKFVNLTACISSPNNTAKVSCLEALSADDILAAQESLITAGTTGGGLGFPAFVPVIDAVEFKTHPLLLAKNGTFSNPVPLLVGTNQNDGSSFNELPVNATMRNVTAYANFLFTPALVNATLLRYKRSVYNKPWDLMTQVLGDFLFACPTKAAALMITRTGLPVFQYEFSHRSFFPMSYDCAGVSLARSCNTSFRTCFTDLDSAKTSFQCESVSCGGPLHALEHQRSRH